MTRRRTIWTGWLELSRAHPAGRYWGRARFALETFADVVECEVESRRSRTVVYVPLPKTVFDDPTRDPMTELRRLATRKIRARRVTWQRSYDDLHDPTVPDDRLAPTILVLCERMKHNAALHRLPDPFPWRLPTYVPPTPPPKTPRRRFKLVAPPGGVDRPSGRRHTRTTTRRLPP